VAEVGKSMEHDLDPSPLPLPRIIVFCAIGAFSLNNTSFDVCVLAVFGLFVFRKLDAEPAPLLLAFILGPLIEVFLRRTLLLSQGNPAVLLTRPISGLMLAFGGRPARLRSVHFVQQVPRCHVQRAVMERGGAGFDLLRRRVLLAA
jgi:hypothetical protein